MSVSAIVPVWNGRALLERLFDSLDRQTEPPAEILAVDNGSTDGAPEAAARRGARVIPMGGNTGFAPAVNRGIRESRGEWLAVLNSDVELAPDYFAALLAAARANGAWFATGKILASGAGQRIDGTFDVLCRGGTAWRVGSGRADGPVFSSEQRIWSAPWTAALFRAELFQRVGLLEEAFESYLEDVDFGLRCARAGCSGVYAPAAVARHAGSAALGRWHGETVRRIARNQVWLVARYYPGRWWWNVLVAHGLWGAVAMRHGAAIPWDCGGWGRRFRLSKAGRQAKPPIPPLPRTFTLWCAPARRPSVKSSR
ncbi:MAG: glycosyltransferase family 2 protein [Acidobacteriia bacterium]|nr:glycosyltransferase family 2 protein [Terriglobia bacterium]